jgi:nucleotide-binding universal stress UspA family protein
VENILVALDFSEVTVEVIKHASQLGRALSAKLWLVHAGEPEPAFIGYESGPQTVRDAVAGDLREDHRRTQQVAEKLRRSGLEATALCPQGSTVETILREAEKLHADLIVMGSHGRGAVYRALLGSVSEGVLRKAACPVLIVPARSVED